MIEILKQVKNRTVVILERSTLVSVRDQRKAEIVPKRPNVKSAIFGAHISQSTPNFFKYSFFGLNFLHFQFLILINWD